MWMKFFRVFTRGVEFLLALVGVVAIVSVIKFVGWLKGPDVPESKAKPAAVVALPVKNSRGESRVPVVGGCGCDAGQWCDAEGGGWYCLRADGTKKLSGK